jgi:hypothetical protein
MPRAFVALGVFVASFAHAQPSPPAAVGAAPLFTAIPAEKSGVNMRHPLVANHPQAYLYTSGFACGGIAIGDVNSDGRPDLFFTSGPESNRLYLQTTTPLRFQDAGEGRFSGPALSRPADGNKPWSAGATLVDLNRDGHLDIYVCNYDAPNQLFINDGAARFRDEAAEWGLDIVDASLMSAFMDIDGSGELALYLLTNRYERPGGRPQRPPVVFVNGQPRIAPEFEKYYGLKQSGPSNFHVDFVGRSDRLYVVQRGDQDLEKLAPGGRRRYRDVSREAGLMAESGHGLSATWFDYDGDARPDLYVCNDFADADCFYHNEGPTGDGIIRFKNVIADVVPMSTWSSMGADAADINNDGWLDLVTGDMASRSHTDAMINTGNLADRLETLLHSWPRQTMRNMMFLNTGTGRFLETAYLSGIAHTDWTWAVKLADFDNDGRVDVFFTTGASRNYTDADLPFTTEMYIGHTDWDLLRDHPPRREENLAFRNVDGLRFEDVSRAWRLNHRGMSYGAAHGDLDRDGDLDLVVCNLDETVSIYRNDTPRDRHWLEVQLRGTASHTHGWGAVVRVKTASGWRVRQMNPGTGFLSCNDPLLHFGLGRDKTIEAVEVRWPSGRLQQVDNPAADQVFTITEPTTDEALSRGSADSARSSNPTPQSLFEPTDDLDLSFRHQETPYDDYAREPLLPGKLSQLGPGIAVGDANGDGHDDIFFGGAAGQAGALFVKQGDGRFARVAGPWEADAACEDMGALWLDADGDGRLDLYVVSGGVEGFEGDRVFQDRLYLNDSPRDGPVRFVKVPTGSIPDSLQAGSAVCAADFDRDGDLDLFLGSRSVPGRYPQTPRSILMRNDSTPGRVIFVDASDQLAPGLAAAGLVTSAIWSDVDVDGHADLLVVCEWGPVKLFSNQRGKLVEQSGPAGLDERHGWWNGIAPGDFDGDGRIDYLVTNVGLNTKFGAPNSNRPSLLFAGDLDSSGGYQLVEAQVVADGIWPVRSRSAVAGAMPTVALKFPTFRDYASARVTDMFGLDKLRQGLRLAANEFRSGVLLNRSVPGKPEFEWQPLPDPAQVSPGYGIAVADFNGDGWPDAAIAQNLFTREPETGLWRGGLSQLLISTADQGLIPLAALESGVMIPGDAKGAASVDLDGDARPDLLIAQNNDAAIPLRNRAPRDWLSLRLESAKGTPAIGAQAAIHFADGRRIAAELSAGTGYLSQSAPEIYIGLGQATPVRADIRWTTGQTQQVDLNGKTGRVTLKAPARP